MPKTKTIELFCTKCKTVFNYKKNGNNLHFYESDNDAYIKDGSKKIECDCGCSKLKCNGLLKKSDVI